MLALVYFQTHYIDRTAVKDIYNFYWRTGGGAHHKFIIPVNRVDELVQRLAERAKEYPNWRRKIQRTGKSSETLLRETMSVRELPKEPEQFFKILREYIEFDWTDRDGKIVIATHWPGKIIGIRGKNIKAIKRHLSRDIEVVLAYYFTRPLGAWYNGKAKIYDVSKIYKNGVIPLAELKNYLVAELPEKEVISRAFKVHQNKSYGFEIDSGWIAPWEVTRCPNL